LAGNVANLSSVLTVTIDSIAPTAPVVTSVSPSVVAGTAEATSIVDLFDGATKIGTTTADGSGVWSIPIALGAGSHALTATASDVAGNTSAASETSGVVTGTAGNDVLFAPGPDLAVGGAGNDVYLVDHVDDRPTEAVGEGFDTVYASVGYTLPDASEIEFLIANAGATGLALTGNAFANTIFGGGGDDTIAGGGGADMLFGGLGADVFALLALTDSTVDPTGQDIIGDFSALAGDLIGLSAIDANSLLGGNQAFAFIGDAAFSAAGQVRAEIVGGMTVVSGDVNGDGSADFALRLTGAHTLNAGNFIL
jgi:Ca2+-binding RTX toxin-like protein